MPPPAARLLIMSSSSGGTAGWLVVSCPCGLRPCRHTTSIHNASGSSTYSYGHTCSYCWCCTVVQGAQQGCHQLMGDSAAWSALQPHGHLAQRSATTQACANQTANKCRITLHQHTCQPTIVCMQAASAWPPYARFCTIRTCLPRSLPALLLSLC